MGTRLSLLGTEVGNRCTRRDRPGVVEGEIERECPEKIEESDALPDTTTLGLEEQVKLFDTVGEAAVSPLKIRVTAS